MVDRAKVLAVAAQVYGEYGFRGATTKRIAEIAGVNEVTLFRLFGSKRALIDAAVRGSAQSDVPEDLPLVPHDPERELTSWCTQQLEHLRNMRTLIRQTLSEMDQRPSMASCMRTGPTLANSRMLAYVQRLKAHGFLGATDSDVDIHTAVSMLMSALFADAMGRDMMPEVYPASCHSAAAAYVRIFVRALAIRASTPQSEKKHRDRHSAEARKASRVRRATSQRSRPTKSS